MKSELRHSGTMMSRMDYGIGFVSQFNSEKVLFREKFISLPNPHAKSPSFRKSHFLIILGLEKLSGLDEMSATKIIKAEAVHPLCTESHAKQEHRARELAWRSFAKAISWRAVGTLDTFFLSFFIIKYLGPLFGYAAQASDLHIAATASFIALAEILTKIVIYTAHERAWNYSAWGVIDGRLGRDESRIRSIIKMSTWRVLASLDTMLLALVFTGNLVTAISIGGLEVITKLFLYYFHERLWLKIKFGLEN